MTIEQINAQAAVIGTAYRSGWLAAAAVYPRELNEDVAGDYIDGTGGIAVDEIYIEAWLAGYAVGRHIAEEDARS